MIGLQFYDAFYMQREGQSLLGCLSLKTNAKNGSSGESPTGLACMARIYFTGNLIQTPSMLDAFKNEAILCKSGFPCNVSGFGTRKPDVSNKTHQLKKGMGTHTMASTGKFTVSASDIRRALQNFMYGDGYEEFVCDARKTKGNGLGFRAVHHEGHCVALLCLLRNNVMLIEQPLFGSQPNDPDDGIGPSSSLFVLNATVMRTFLGLSTDEGLVEIAFRECCDTGVQKSTFSYYTKEGAGGHTFTASVLLEPTCTNV